MTRTWRVIGLVGIGAMCLLHNDQWLFGQGQGDALFDSAAPVFGWLPADMAYHLAWVGLGVGVSWALLAGTWRKPS